MKKILTIAFSAMLLASSSYAVALNWAVTAANADKDGKALAGATVALVKGTTAASAADIVYAYENGAWSLTGGELITVGTLNDAGKFAAPKSIAVGSEGWGTGKYTGTDFEGNATDITSQGTGTANTTKYYMLVFDSSYTDGNYTVLSPAAATTINLPTQAAGAAAFSTAAGAGSDWKSVAVPEPCSVALLALGLAAFGLKRKVA